MSALMKEITKRDDIFNFINCKRIAIMGGTFDPVHYGHLVTAEAVRHEYNVEYVIFIPTGKPPHKPDYFVSNSEHRYLMTVLATVNNPYFAVSRLEIDRSGDTYTIDTINEIRKICGENIKIYFISGADAINQILTWKDSDKLLKLCSFIAVTRPGYNKDNLYKQVQKMKTDYRTRIHFLEVPALAISSSDIRDRVRAAKPIKYLLPEEVERYIQKFGLYKDENGAAKTYFGFTGEEINGKLRKSLSEKRFIHTQGVAEESVKLAAHYGVDKDAAYVSALLHDTAKCLSNDELLKYCKKYNLESDSVMKKKPELLHCIVGAEIAKQEYHVNDETILNSIRYHTTGRAKMSILEKIIYIADFIEPNRSVFPGLDEIRRLAYTNLDQALIMSLKSTIKYNKGKGSVIHPWSIDALAYLEKNDTADFENS